MSETEPIETLHPAVAKATEWHVRLMLVDDDTLVHSVICPNGWADTPTETSCGKRIKRMVSGGDAFYEPCEACLNAAVERGQLTNG